MTLTTFERNASLLAPSGGKPLLATAWRADIDGLRAVAVLSVLVFHALPDVLPGGFVGVDVFFVISGYLITALLLGELRDERFNLWAFYGRRVRRIFPALLVVVALTLGFGWLALLGSEYRQLGKHAAAAAGFVSNLVFWREVGYFDNAAETKPLLHLWSLAIEEQFYLAWPLVLWFVWRRGRHVTRAALVVTCLSFAIGLLVLLQDSAAAFYAPWSRGWELAAGALIACWQVKCPSLMQPNAPSGALVLKTHDVASVAGLILIVTACVGLSKNHAFPGAWALLPVAGAALLIAAGPAAWANRHLLSRPTMVWVGLISYPLYLWHWPVLAYLRIVEGRVPEPWLRVAAIAVCVPLAWLTWRVVEQPIRRTRHAMHAVVGLCAGMIAIGAAGWTLVQFDGLPTRLRDFEQRAGQLLADNVVVEAEPDCGRALGLGIPRYCRAQDLSRPATVALLGDSHANRLFEPLTALFAPRGYNLVQLGAAGCLPFWDTETSVGPQSNRCPAQVNPQLEHVLRSPTIATVLLTHRGPLYLLGDDPGRSKVGAAAHALRQMTGALAADAPSAAVFEHGLDDTVGRLNRGGKRVVLVLDNPELDFDPRACLQRPMSLTALVGRTCAMPRDQVDERNQLYRMIVKRVAAAHPGTRVVDMAQPLCGALQCIAQSEGVILYRDSDHLNRSGARRVVAALSEEFLGALR